MAEYFIEVDSSMQSGQQNTVSHPRRRDPSFETTTTATKLNLPTQNSTNLNTYATPKFKRLARTHAMTSLDVTPEHTNHGDEEMFDCT